MSGSDLTTGPSHSASGGPSARIVSGTARPDDQMIIRIAATRPVTYAQAHLPGAELRYHQLGMTPILNRIVRQSVFVAAPHHYIWGCNAVTAPRYQRAAACDPRCPCKSQISSELELQNILETL